jgi:hypothetical membrane protein
VTQTVAPTRPRMRCGARALGRLAVAGVVVYVGIDVLLRFLRPSYSLLYNAESDYGRGPWYWVMDINFLLRCALSLAVIAALKRSSGHSAGRPGDGGRVGLVLIAIWAVGSGLLAFFADNPAGTPVTASGLIHLVLGFIALFAAAAGTIVVSASLRSDPSWRPEATVLLVLSVAGAAAFLLLAAASGHKHLPSGLFERIFLGLELLWLALAGWYAATRARRPGKVRVSRAL